MTFDVIQPLVEMTLNRQPEMEDNLLLNEIIDGRHPLMEKNIQ